MKASAGAIEAPAPTSVVKPAHQPLSFGLVDGRPVFVDVDDDTYFALEPEEERKFLQQMSASDLPQPVACQSPTSSAL